MFSGDLMCSASSYPLHIKKHLQPIVSRKFKEHKVSTMRKASSSRRLNCKSTECKLSSQRRIKFCPVSKSGVDTGNYPPPNGPSVSEASHNPQEKRKKKKISALVAVKPENQEIEKERFWKSKYTYNPQFIYKNPATDKTLQKHGHPSKKILLIAIKIIETALRRYISYDDYERKAGGAKMTDREVIGVVKKYLCEEGLRNISVCLSDDLVARASMTRINGQSTLQIQRGNVRENWIEGMLRHEIGTHYIRAHNNRLQIWKTPKTRKELQMEPANPTEEGLASLNTVLLRDDPCLIRAAMLYYTVTKAADLSFCELFEELGRYIQDPETKWDYCLRAKRGYSDTSKPGAFQKDQIYLKGLLRILKHRHSIDFNLLFRMGKVSFEDIEKLKDIAQLQSTCLPSFAAGIDQYGKCLENIMRRNGLTDQDLECIE